MALERRTYTGPLPQWPRKGPKPGGNE